MCLYSNWCYLLLLLTLVEPIFDSLHIRGKQARLMVNASSKQGETEIVQFRTYICTSTIHLKVHHLRTQLGLLARASHQKKVDDPIRNVRRGFRQADSMIVRWRWRCILLFICRACASLKDVWISAQVPR